MQILNRNFIFEGKIFFVGGNRFVYYKKTPRVLVAISNIKYVGEEKKRRNQNLLQNYLPNINKLFKTNERHIRKNANKIFLSRLF
jgi:hypothetical protein